MQSLRTDSEATGAEFAFNNRVIGIDEDATSYIVTTDRKKIRAACLINAAGLYADDIAALALHHKKYTIRPLRGEYYELVTPRKKASLDDWCILPCLLKRQARVFISVPGQTDSCSWDRMRWPSRTKRTTLSQKTPPGMFIETLQKFLPALDERDLRWAYSGIRPCVMTGDRRKSDFIVSVDREDPPLINLVGIESPGLSAALALARHVGDLPIPETFSARLVLALCPTS